MILASHRQTVLVATRNPSKFQEMLELIGPNFSLLSRNTLLAAPEIEEVGDTFEINARLKAEGISRCFPGWVLAEDSGLEVDALQGKPGVHSARFAGIGATSAKNRALLLKRLSTSCIPEGQRTARLHCVLALARSGDTLLTAAGTVKGTITRKERGEGGFGYDSLFLPFGYTSTFAELPSAVRNKISHRSRAFREFHRLWVATMK